MNPFRQLLGVCAVSLVMPASHAACTDPAAQKVDWTGCSKERLILKDKALQEAKFERLMAAGVRIWSYEPTMMHAKIILVDDLVACVGSANFDRRSMKLNHELEVIVLDPSVVAALDGHYDDDVGRSSLIEEASWADRGTPQRALEMAVRPFRGRL